ncbi:hypothetical protein VNO78_18110 [Psophocarpus tetragonolobus]|uniref:Uncharacterized protein n=1 Tax=Psophocarpus tetragonolobus TaxID=3891 RepID=A0AAN9SPC1_PSOTE
MQRISPDQHGSRFGVLQYDVATLEHDGIESIQCDGFEFNAEGETRMCKAMLLKHGQCVVLKDGSSSRPPDKIVPNKREGSSIPNCDISMEVVGSGQL